MLLSLYVYIVTTIYHMYYNIMKKAISYIALAIAFLTSVYCFAIGVKYTIKEDWFGAIFLISFIVALINYREFKSKVE